MSASRKNFEDAAALDAALSEILIDQLAAAIDARGEALLAVSGGSTPLGLFSRLSGAALDFSKVTVTLTDDRCVAFEHPDSNAQMVRRLLLQHNASPAQFMPLYDSTLDLAAQTHALNARFQALPTFDAVVLGMGLDGHTASLFPGAEGLSDAMDLASDLAAVALQPLTAPHTRISLSAARLLNTRNLFLHVTGDEKLQVLTLAEASGLVAQYPVGLFLRHEDPKTQVFWAP